MCINSVKETCFSQKYQKWIYQVLEMSSWFVEINYQFKITHPCPKKRRNSFQTSARGRVVDVFLKRGCLFSSFTMDRWDFSNWKFIRVKRYVLLPQPVAVNKSISTDRQTDRQTLECVTFCSIWLKNKSPHKSILFTIMFTDLSQCVNLEGQN